MFRQYTPIIPEHLGDIYNLLGFMMVKSPRFEEDIFPGQNVETVFFELTEGLDVVRGDLGEERFHKLVSLAHQMRAYFEADPEDTNGEARKGRALIREMEAIVLSAVKPPSYPPMSRDEMIVLGTQLRMMSGTPQERDVATERLLVALPHGNIMALLLDDIEVSVEDAVDEAMQREAASKRS